MSISLRNIKYCAIFLILILFLLFPPPVSYSSQLFYTIQTGSFTNVADAQKQFDFIVRGLNKKEIDYLRIEKIGEFYSARIGKFEDRVIAEKFLQANKPQLSTAIILKAYIKDKRVIRLYADSSQVNVENDYNLGLNYGASGKHRDSAIHGKCKEEVYIRVSARKRK